MELFVSPNFEFNEYDDIFAEEENFNINDYVNFDENIEDMDADMDVDMDVDNVDLNEKNSSLKTKILLKTNPSYIYDLRQYKLETTFEDIL